MICCRPTWREVSTTSATRAGTHLAADTLAQRYSARTRHCLRQIGAGFALLPWALFVLFAGKVYVISSVLGLESFPDTNNPGYFIIKLALLVLALLVLIEGAIELFRPLRVPRPQ